jgi:hypothetical protein
VLTSPNDPKRDYVWYAVGSVHLSPAGHLAGDLDLYLNDGAPTKTQPGGESMRLPPKCTLGLEIFPDGTFTYQQKLDSKPVGGMPPIKVAATPASAECS